MSEFGFGNTGSSEFNPTHGDIDWAAVYNANHPDNGELPVWYEHEDELGALQEQCHQQNTVIWLNRADPKFDCVVVSDPRDGNAFWFSRDKVGDPMFQNIVDAISGEVLVASTKYPTERCVDYVLMCAFREINEMTGELEDGTADS